MENQLIYQPIHVGEVYANKNRLYRVESIDGEYSAIESRNDDDVE